MVDQLKSVASILNELKTSVILVAAIVFLVPTLATLAILYTLGLKVTDTFDEISANEAKQVEIWERVLDLKSNETESLKRFLAWAEEDERRDSTLHAEVIRWIQKQE